MNKLPLGDMQLDTFLSEYWQKKPLLIQNAIPDIVPPVAADVLAGLACEADVEARLIIHRASANKEQAWELKHGPFNDDIFSALPETHWTLLVQAVDQWLPEASRLLQQFEFIPRWRIDDLMISYASDGGGVGPHYDNYDVFLVQTTGKRRWEIGGLYNESSPRLENLPLTILSEFEALETWVLEPGDILYVPPGYGHNGTAEGDDCMTCSVGFRAPSHSEILREYTDHIGEQLNEASRYADPDLLAQTNTGEISAQALDKIQHILRQYVEDKDAISDWFGRYITTPKYHQAHDLEIDKTESDYSIANLQSHLKAGGLLARNESSRFAFEIQNEQHILFVDGQRFETSKELTAFVETLCSEIELSYVNFNPSEKNLNFLLRLIQHGSLYLVET